MASASDPPAHPALQPADRLILPPQHPPAAVETSIGPPHYPAECTHSHASVQPSLRARTGHANSDSLDTFVRSWFWPQACDRGLRQTGLIDRLGIAADLGEGPMAANRGNLVYRTTGFGEPAALRLAQAVRGAMRQTCFIAPSTKSPTEGQLRKRVLTA